jgi:hypothetical protein
MHSLQQVSRFRKPISQILGIQKTSISRSNPCRPLRIPVARDGEGRTCTAALAPYDLPLVGKGPRCGFHRHSLQTLPNNSRPHRKDGAILGAPVRKYPGARRLRAGSMLRVQVSKLDEPASGFNLPALLSHLKGA